MYPTARVVTSDNLDDEIVVVVPFRIVVVMSVVFWEFSDSVMWRLWEEVMLVTAVSAFFRVMLAKERACSVKGAKFENIGVVADWRM